MPRAPRTNFSAVTYTTRRRSGERFEPLLAGLPARETTCVLPLADGRVFAGTARGIVELTADGEAWRALYETHEFARAVASTFDDWIASHRFCKC